MKRFALVTAAAIIALTGCSYSPPPVSDQVQKYYDENVASRKATPPAAAGPKVAFLGDSYTAGSGANPGGGYAYLLSNAMRWQPVVLGEGGTGYVNPGPTGSGRKPFTDRVADVVAAKPSIVIVQGSTNDSGEDKVRAAATQVYSQLKAGLPDAKIIVVGPLDPPKADHTAIPGDRQALADAASEAGLLFIDPVAERWVTDPARFPVDGLHPDQTGHAQIAEALASKLSSAGIKPAA